MIETILSLFSTILSLLQPKAKVTTNEQAPIKQSPVDAYNDAASLMLTSQSGGNTSDGEIIANIKSKYPDQFRD